VGTALFDNQSVPTTPAAGKSRLFVDSTTKRPIFLDDTGGLRGTFLSGNDSTATQTLPSGGETYITNSGLQVPSPGFKAGMLFRWYLWISKTAAGTGAAVFRLKQANGKRDRQRTAVPVLCRHAQHIRLVFGFSRRHDLAITVPVARAEALGDNQIEGLAERFRRGETEDPGRRVIPIKNFPVRTGGDDRIRRGLNKSPYIKGLIHCSCTIEASLGRDTAEILPNLRTN